MTIFGVYSLVQLVALAGYELLLFAGVFFLIGTLDDIAIDLYYLWVKLTGKARTMKVDRAELSGQPLLGTAAVMIPAWQEAEVIGATVAHMLAAWPQAELRIYVGCYSNDPETAWAVVRAGNGDPRLRLVIHDRAGPTSKADCLNRLFSALREDEERNCTRARMVLLHDAEDMVDAAALPLLDRAMRKYDFVQIPVLPEPQADSRWISGHYCDEFAEAHGKSMVVRNALGVGLPAAGVGCAFDRDVLDRVARRNGMPEAPFASRSLTEDYELGLKISEIGGKSTFLRARGTDGRLVATRACFPASLSEAVRQKTRWIHGIAFQGWDRMGWSGQLGERWMRLRDRRGPFAAFVLTAAYLFLIVAAVIVFATFAGLLEMPEPGPVVSTMMMLNLMSFLWRVGWRFVFATREYGLMEGLLAVLRIPVSNIIAIMAGHRALSAYWRTLRGEPPHWEKTAHRTHPALMSEKKVLS
ncbi:hypothetical protein MB02_00880 [Croceicoccus estronivorus]|uniref:glycosyl transferase family protein n=1 Tax=Croceicoccus estronivorus TaxID=1172626 RepID=UPI000837258B|nr:glycosyl transferase family protein [Croceicoccus estronivorus]OCC25266.1 hypothetical protein MB02_00880 [Croceicoccus estronivorus]